MPMGCDDGKRPRSSNDQTVDSFEVDLGDHVPAPREETVDHTEWAAEAEGYTPLADLTMNAFAGAIFMAMPPADEGGSGVFFADMSAFPSAPYASIPHSYDSDDSDGDHNGVDDGIEIEAIDISLAEQALQALDEEYSMTLRGHVPDLSKQHESGALNPTAQPPSSVLLRNELEEKIRFADAGFDASKPVASMFPTLDLFKPPEKDLPSIDTDAVKRAVAAIQLKAPKLISNLNKWQIEHRDILAPKDHPIIPQAPLSAFRKRTAKALQATANLSRAATIADALNRISCLKGQDTLTIHVIGADHVECASEDILRTFFGPLVRWIGAVENRAPKSIQIHLIGPNLTSATVAPVELMPLSKLKKLSPLTSAWATCHASSYHDWLTSSGWTIPALVIAFNAGIWGYSDWRPTMEALCHATWAVPLVVTSYTIQEAEDDADVMNDIIASCGKGGNTSLWSVEANPFGSRMVRETTTAIEGREYRENAAWQAWLLGFSVMRSE